MSAFKRKKAYSLYYILLVVAFIMICVTIISSSFLNISYANKLSQVKKEIVGMQYQIGEVFPEALRQGYKPNQNASTVTISSLDGYSFTLETVETIGATGRLSIKKQSDNSVYWEEDYTITSSQTDSKTVSYTITSSSGLDWSFSYNAVYTASDLSAIDSITRTDSHVNVK